MLPIFKEYIQFLKDKGVDIPIQEGYYWIDKQIIKAYDIEGNLHKLYRLKIDDDFKITYTKYKNKIQFDLEHWNHTVSRKLNRLQRLERYANKLIQVALSKYNQHQPAVLYSGGKDSTVANYLVQQNETSKVIFSNTSLDCADTYKHIKNMSDVVVINPDKGFYQWFIQNRIIPTRFTRACCDVYKEGAMTEKLNKKEKYLFFIGMRNQESSHRSQYKNKWRNEKWGDREWQGILPIRKWTEEDVWLYIFWKGLDFNSKYRKGYSRVGCAIACPFYTKSTWVLDQYWYPSMYKRWHNILEKDFIDNAKWTRLNCTIKEYHLCWNGGMLRSEPTEEVIQELAEYKNLDYSIAKKYFNQECSCGKKVNKKDEVAMNLKLLGRKIEKFMCKKCLMKYLGIDKEMWKKYIEDFKLTGCELF